MEFAEPNKKNFMSSTYNKLVHYLKSKLERNTGCLLA